MFERSIGGERDNRSLSAVLGERDDSVNTTIFLELILVIVGETFYNVFATGVEPVTRNLEDFYSTIELCEYMVPSQRFERWTS